MNIIKPKRLCPGHTLGIIAPASPGDKGAAEAGMAFLETQGFTIKLGKSVFDAWGDLAGPDLLRAEDINTMFADPQIDGIICLRGGYGTMRLLNLLDYALIKKNPKVFVGYSDITALHLSINQRTGLATFHGPMTASDFGKNPPDYTWNAFRRAVTAPEPLGLIANPPDTPSPIVITPGEAAGTLTGGNLSLIAATLGTPYEIDTRGKLLFLEDVGEAPYRIDRMLTQLTLAGKLADAAGIVLDVFAGCQEEADSTSFSVEEVLYDRLGHLQKPVLYKLYFGHTPLKATLPIGVRATLNNEGLSILEAAVTE
ncbi:MAG: LD-carboxypeptidase [Pelosinus sp.]|nr:LD-carboxypeptidase [Pelosinus sp.]